MTSTTSRRLALVGEPGQHRDDLSRLFEETAYRVSCVDSAEDAQRALTSTVFAVVVLVAPPASAAREISRLCESTSTPVLVLTSSRSDADVARALDAGAADAVAYPHAPRELLARLRLALRRLRSASLQRAMRFGDLALDLDAGVVLRGGQRLALSRREYRVLVELMLAAGRVVPREELLRRVWGAEDEGRLNDLRVHINRLRGKLGAGDPSTPIIESMLGVGYRLVLREMGR